MNFLRLYPTLLSLLIVAICYTLVAANPPKTPYTEKAKTVTMGVYVTSIHDINLQENHFGVDFWVWFVYRKEYTIKNHFNPLQTVKLLDVYNGEISESYIKIDSSLKYDYYVLKKVSAKVRNAFDVHDFPFDKQILKLHFEDAENEARKLQFNIAETAFSKSGIDTNLHINGIKIRSDFNIHHEPHTYSNNFGNPKNLKNKDAFDRVAVTITIQREVGFLFLKLFTGLYVSFLIAVISLFVHPKDVSTRFSLPVGALFAAVGNKYFVDELLPNVNSLTLADMLHSLTFIYIFLIILYSVINLYIVKHSRYHSQDVRVISTDVRSFFILFFSYILLNLVFIVQAAG